MTVGVNHEPIKAVATTENNVATYSVGTGAGRALKFAVKPPNFNIDGSLCVITIHVQKI
jgi:hypothetical protein